MAVVGVVGAASTHGATALAVVNGVGGLLTLRRRPCGPRVCPVSLFIGRRPVAQTALELDVHVVLDALV